MLKDTMHEVREFNRVIKAHSEMLTTLLQIDHYGEGVSLSLNAINADNARDQAQAILHTAQMVSARLDLIDLQINPDIFQKEARVVSGVYSKFDKARKMLRMRARAKNVNIKMEGRSHRQIDAYRVFDILPFLLLENAVKYAPSGTEVVVSINEYPAEIEASVDSIGPTLGEDEKERITESGFRGKGAIATGEKGSGFGLYFAQFISDLHGMKLRFSTENRTFDYNGCTYASFRATLRVPL